MTAAPIRLSLAAAAGLARQPMLSLGTMGFGLGAFLASMPDFQDRAGVSDAGLGVALIFAAFGGISALMIGPRFATLTGKRMLTAGGCVAAVGTLAPLIGTGPVTLCLAFFLLGGFLSLLDILANIVLSEAETRHDRPLMNVGHAGYSFAFGVAALMVALARGAGLGPGAILPVAALVVLGLALCVGRLEMDVARAEAAAEAARHPWAAVLPAGAIIFASVLGENATEGWSALHIERTLGAAPGVGSFGPTIFAFTMCAARLSGQFLAQRFGEVRLVCGSAVVSTAGLVLLALAPSVGAALAGVLLTGCGLAVAVPSACSILGRRVAPGERALAISRAMAGGYTGFFIGPSMIGFIAEFSSLRLSFLAVALVVGLMAPAVLRLDRQQRPAAALP